MKRIISVLLILTLLSVSVLTFASCGEKDQVYIASIDIKDHGVITVELHTAYAPETVKNFVSLAESGFYNGLTFHRIIKGFMMQGGDPRGDGSGDSGKDIKGEFALNGHDGNPSHTRGVISMARGGSGYEAYVSQLGYSLEALPESIREDILNGFNSASCQFFIVHEDSPHLDGSYASFGFVTSGMEIVDAICNSAQPTDDNGSIAKENQPIINSITIEKIS